MSDHVTPTRTFTVEKKISTTAQKNAGKTASSVSETMARKHVRAQKIIPVWLSVVAVAAMAINLRPGATSIGLVLSELRKGLAMGSGAVAFLSAMPPLFFGIGAIFAARIGKRLGVGFAMAVMLALLVIGLAGRVAVSQEMFFLFFTLVALSAIAVTNVLLPVFIKKIFPNRVAMMMSIYTTLLPIGGIAPCFLTPAVHASHPDDWRISLGLWAFVAFIGFVIWLVVAFLMPRRSTAEKKTGGALCLLHIARTRKGLTIAIFFGVQSMQAYTIFGWLPQIFRDAGLTSTQAALLLSIYTIISLPGGLIMPTAAQKMRRPALIAVGLTAFLFAGYTGLLIAPTTLPWAWVVLLSISGWAFQLAISLITTRSHHPEVTAQLSGFSQSAGYLIAAFGTWLVGFVHGLFGGWHAPIIILMVSGVLFGIFGVLAASKGNVDDQLPERIRPQ